MCSESKADQCVFYRKIMDKLTIITGPPYVDDLLICANDLTDLEKTKHCLMNKFEMKDLGEIQNILGLRVSCNSEIGQISLDQTMYINTVLDKFNMKDCNSVSTPSDPNQKLENFEESTEINVPYQETIGCLLYIARDQIFPMQQTC